MKSKFELPEAIFNVTQNFSNKTRLTSSDKARKSAQMPPNALNGAAETTEPDSQKFVLEIAKWTALISVIAMTISMIYEY